MENPKQKFRQSSIVFEKSDILPANLKILTSSNYPTVQYFLLILRIRFELINVYKRECGIFLFGSHCLWWKPKTYVYTYDISSHEWFRTHKLCKSHRGNIYAIMKTMHPPGYHHSGFEAARALTHMMYGWLHHVLKRMSYHKIIVVITGRVHCFHNCIYKVIIICIYIWYNIYIYIYMI